MFWKFVIWMYKALSSWDEGLHTLSVPNDYSHGLIWKWRVKEYKSIHQWSRRSSGQHELRQAKSPRIMSPVKRPHDASPPKLHPDGAVGRGRCRQGVLCPPPLCASSHPLNSFPGPSLSARPGPAPLQWREHSPA